MTPEEIIKKNGYLVVYIASKYNAPTDGDKLRNVNYAIDWAIRVYNEKGHHPYIPVLSHWIEKRMDYNKEKPRDNTYWYKFDNMIVPKMDALFKVAKDGESKGADAEEKLAKSLGIHVYKNFDDIPSIREKLKVVT